MTTRYRCNTMGSLLYIHSKSWISTEKKQQIIDAIKREYGDKIKCVVIINYTIGSHDLIDLRK